MKWVHTGLTVGIQWSVYGGIYTVGVSTTWCFFWVRVCSTTDESSIDLGFEEGHVMNDFDTRCVASVVERGRSIQRLSHMDLC